MTPLNLYWLAYFSVFENLYLLFRRFRGRAKTFHDAIKSETECTHDDYQFEVIIGNDIAACEHAANDGQ